MISSPLFPKGRFRSDKVSETEKSFPRVHRLGVIGCGAVARDFHIPVLAGLEGVRLAALVDCDETAARKLAQSYDVEIVHSDAGQLSRNLIDAALVTTPPHFHAPIAIDLMRRGIHVLVEKPMAVRPEEAEEMVRTAEETGTVLAVGHFRRLFPSTRLMAALLDSGVLGKPVSFDVEEGHIFDWPSATLGSMRKDLAGGGVLLDTGSHTLDQLLAFFSGPAELLEYRDNSLGGIESDCELRLRIHSQNKPVEGRVELSRTRKLRNTFRIECEKGILELPIGEREHVSILPHDRVLHDPATGSQRLVRAKAEWEGDTIPVAHAAFRAEVDDWLKAISLREQPYLSGSSVLPTVRLIDECYHQALPLYEPWLGEVWAESSVASSPRFFPPKSKNAKRVLVTGATGFIGCRVVEILSAAQEWQVRALVHNPGSASRLARLPVEMVQGDLRSADDMARAVEGCDAVVHCAYGTSWGRRREIFDVTVKGTSNLAEAARAAKVHRFVHLSTVAIHGHNITGELSELTPVCPPRGDDYAQSKAKAEQVLAKAARQGLGSVTLRLANVYGPFSGPYTIRPIQQILMGVPLLVGSGDTPSNTVYVDNVVEAILCALRAPDSVNGGIFTISDGDTITWAEFLGNYAQALGRELLSIPAGELDRLRALQRSGGLSGWIRSWNRGWKTILTSSELRSFAGKFLQTDPVGWLPRRTLEALPWVKRWMRRSLGMDRPFIYYGQPSDVPPLPPLELLELFACPAQVKIEKARQKLGYAPTMPRRSAMDLTISWARHARLI